MLTHLEYQFQDTIGFFKNNINYTRGGSPLALYIPSKKVFTSEMNDSSILNENLSMRDLQHHFAVVGNAWFYFRFNFIVLLHVLFRFVLSSAYIRAELCDWGISIFVLLYAVVCRQISWFFLFLSFLFMLSFYVFFFIYLSMVNNFCWGIHLCWENLNINRIKEVKKKSR